MIDDQVKQYCALNEWFQSPLGLFVAHEFSAQLERVNEFLNGDILLQLGNCGSNSWLNHLNFKHKWLASPFTLDKTIDIECSLHQTPLNRNSVDCVFVPLTLEPFGNNFSLIDEIDRIIKPMGYIVLLGINPSSLWGGAMKMGLLHCYQNRKIKMRNSFHLNRIFLQRGYRQCFLNNFCYIPPVNNSKLIKKLAFLDEVGKMIWPFPSGFYCYIAQKYEYITPSYVIKPIQKAVTDQYKTPLFPVIN